jgi:phosphate transport system permease protein
MSAVTTEPGSSASARSVRFHRWRTRKDKLARWLIAVGGVAVIWMVVLIFFYLLWVVVPLFLPASSDMKSVGARPEWYESPAVWLSLEEQKEIGLKVSETGRADFFQLSDGKRAESVELPLDSGSHVVRVAESPETDHVVAYATDDGRVRVFRHTYHTDFSEGVAQRRIVPSIEFPFGGEALFQFQPGAPADLAISSDDKKLVIAAADEKGLLNVLIGDKQENFLTGEISLAPRVIEARLDLADGVGSSSATVTGVGISGDHRWLYVGDSVGNLHRYALDTLELIENVEVFDSPLTEISMMLGGISVLAGSGNGEIAQILPVRDENNQIQLRVVRRFDPLESAIRVIIPEQRRKGFLALDQSNDLGIYHGTAGSQVLLVDLGETQFGAAALAPRADGLLFEDNSGALGILGIDNQHPEVSASSLWKKVWYENYPEPEFIWQSSAATNDFEPKFSLTPLVFGTIKAAAYAMLFAIPLALMGAAYTAYFMTPALRKIVKPTIEIMAALPTVILGFLAGLWFAPFVEQHLSGIFMLLLVIPPGLLLFAWLWHQYNGPMKGLFADGSEAMLLMPVLVVLGLLAMWLADPVQNLFFGGDLRTWLSQTAGIDYDQRNALVVGCAMGFAVIPTIFSIAEDAIFGVPKTLANGSLALGATPWQTLVRVIIPTASPGIFSALMIGLGRAVGETMIVLMATGNTPVMDWNIFEGMRTLAANIAVEMPESEVNSSHYRVLFLAALVLFIFTFIVNTGAEIIRQRLREKYSNL